MPTKDRLWQLAGLLGALGVALGAFGAHGLEQMMPDQDLHAWHTGTRYHLIHAVALLVVSLHPGRPRLAAPAFVIGIFLFSGSLYGLTLTGWWWLGPVTPLGGVAFIVGWLSLLTTRSAS